MLKVRVRLDEEVVVLGVPLFRDETRPNSSEGPPLADWGAVEVRVREKMLGMGSRRP